LYTTAVIMLNTLKIAEGNYSCLFDCWTCALRCSFWSQLQPLHDFLFLFYF